MGRKRETCFWNWQLDMTPLATGWKHASASTDAWSPPLFSNNAACWRIKNKESVKMVKFDIPHHLVSSNLMGFPSWEPIESAKCEVVKDVTTLQLSTRFPINFRVEKWLCSHTKQNQIENWNLKPSSSRKENCLAFELQRALVVAQSNWYFVCLQKNIRCLWIIFYVKCKANIIWLDSISLSLPPTPHSQ